MRPPMRMLYTLSTSLVLVASGACRSGRPLTSEEQQSQQVRVLVENHNYADMAVWAVGDGVSSRIGTVNGNSTGRFALNPSLYSASSFRVDATPIGGFGRASSGILSVLRGQVVVFTIEPDLGLSHGMIQ
jgi:hypothetical protein